MSEYFLLFITGLLGSGHCVGMCGPIVLAYSLQLRAATSGNGTLALPVTVHLPAHLAYNFGRVLMWTFLGALLGLAGALLGSLLPAQRFVSIAGGLGMIFFGAGKFGLLPALQPLKGAYALPAKDGGRVVSMYRRIFQMLIAERSVQGKFALGLANGFLPCGFSFAMLAKAAASSSMSNGAMTMFSFGLGTIPALLLVGTLSTKWNAKQRRWGEAMAAVLVMAMGVLLVLRGFGWHPPFLPMPGGTIKHHH